MWSANIIILSLTLTCCVLLVRSDCEFTEGQKCSEDDLQKFKKYDTCYANCSEKEKEEEMAEKCIEKECDKITEDTSYSKAYQNHNCEVYEDESDNDQGSNDQGSNDQGDHDLSDDEICCGLAYEHLETCFEAIYSEATLTTA